MLINSLKISDITHTELFELIFFHADQKISQKYCHADLSSVSVPLTCWLSISVPTRGFLGIYVTPLFVVYNFRNKSPLRLISSSKYSKFYQDFGNREKNLKSIFPFGDNIVWIGCSKHSLLLRENTCHRLSIC